MFLENLTSQSGRITLESEFSSPQGECPLRTLNQTGCEPSLASCMMVTCPQPHGGKAANARHYISSTPLLELRLSSHTYVIYGQSR
jgi:hypothetical protein